MKSLTESDRQEVRESGTLNQFSVFSIGVYVTTAVPNLSTPTSLSWVDAYERSSWFGDVYRFLQSGHIPDVDYLRRAHFLRTCLEYRIDIDNNVLWKYHARTGLVLPCIPETKVSSVLYEVHDLCGHWGKEGTLTKLIRHAYWPGQSTDVEKYMTGCIQYA